ncbi:MAG TPA: DMT family transporter [Streptosporangiaceae bacterium]|nr:DMT family transporter [Streptosporangiaceae bacterium]
MRAWPARVPGGSALMHIAIALCAALLVGTGLVLQQQAAQQQPTKYFLHLKLIAELIRTPRWLAGIAVMAAGYGLSAYTFDNLQLSVAEPLLATNLLFALLVAIPLAGVRPRKSEIIGAVLLASGVGALSAARAVGAGGDHIGSAAYWPAAAVIGAIALLLVRAGLHRTGQRRATLTGLAAGLIFGISDALTRNALLILDHHGIAAMLTSWPAYSLLAAALLAVWLMESSFSVAPLHASLPGITAGEPVVGILLGVVVFGDVIRITPPLLVLQGAGLLALVVGVILVARAPALSEIREKGHDLRQTASEDLRRTAGRVLPGTGPGPKLAHDLPGTGPGPKLAPDLPGHPEGAPEQADQAPKHPEGV